MEINTPDNKMKVLAYYLPQFHPTEFNDKWYGKGFTEWTNVGKAKPLFKNHYQPKIPADLGYYDLRLPEIAEQQAVLAKYAGVSGFCYWHYWFGNGEELLDMPFKRAVETGSPDFPFCLAWANESWKRKQWDKNAQDLIIKEQKYPGLEDNKQHFYKYLNAFKDRRYLTYDGKPIFIIYKPFEFENVNIFINQWNDLAKQNGLDKGFYFIGMINFNKDHDKLMSLGFSASTLHHMSRLRSDRRLIQRIKRSLSVQLLPKIKKPILIDYRKYINNAWDDSFDFRDDVVPTLLPNWDHSPRSGLKTPIFINTTPSNWEKLVEKYNKKISCKSNKLVIIRAWNEWGEGNYIEPDLKNGTGYLDVLRKYLK